MKNRNLSQTSLKKPSLKLVFSKYEVSQILYLEYFETKLRFRLRNYCDTPHNSVAHTCLQTHERLPFHVIDIRDITLYDIPTKSKIYDSNTCIVISRRINP